MNKRNTIGSNTILEIQELGPIKDSIVELKPFMLFSGESNTGKSYTAMAVYYLFYMLNDETTMAKLAQKVFDIDAIENELNDKDEIELKIPQKLEEEFEKIYNETVSNFMGYMLGQDDFNCRVKLKLNNKQAKDAKITIKKKRTSGDFAHFEFSYKTLNLEGGYRPAPDSKFVDGFNRVINFVYLNLILGRNFMGNIWFERFFLPPARGAFSGLPPSSLLKFSSIGMYQEYLEAMDSIRYRNFKTSEDLQGQKDVIASLFARLMDGKVNTQRDSTSITLKGTQKEIPLTAGSSAIKELYPLYLILNRVPLDLLSICMEEPEAHLHPDLQRKVARLLAYIVNQGALVQATTHSDFFMNQVNNLLKLHYIGEQDKDKLDKILKKTGIEKECIISPEKIGAYYFEKTKNGVKAQKLEVSQQGLPMESFKNTYDESVKETRYLREALDDQEE